MSRKTRKLIWSAPLVAVLAIAGALAIFAVATPGGVFADTLSSAPSNLTAEADGWYAVDLDWDAPAQGSVTGYRIDMSKDGFIWETLVMDTGNSRTSYTDEHKLKAETNRHYRVFVLNYHGAGRVSVPTSAVTDDAEAPKKVTRLRANNVGQDKIMLNWTDPDNTGGLDIIQYCIRWATVIGMMPGDCMADGDATDDNGVILVNAEEATSPSCFAEPAGDVSMGTYIDTDLDPGTTRHYEIVVITRQDDAATGGVDDELASEASDTAVDTTDGAEKPGAPTVLTAVPIANDMINLYWYTPKQDGGTDITGYRVEVWKEDARQPEISVNPGRSDSATFDGGTIDSAVYRRDVPTVAAGDNPIPELVQLMVSVTSTTDKLEFRVFAENGTATGDGIRTSERSSNTVGVTSTAALGRPEGHGVTASTGLDGQINVTINPPTSEPTHYRIDSSKDGRNWEVEVASTRFTRFENNVYEDINLGPDVTRYYRVFILASNGRDLGPAAWNTAAGTTKVSTSPGAVKNLEAEGVSASQIDLSWDIPDSTGGRPIDNYQVQRANPAMDRTVEGGSWDNLACAVGSTTEYSDTDDLEINTKKFYRVIAINKEHPKEPGDSSQEMMTAEIEARVASATTQAGSPPGLVIGLTAEQASDSSGPTTGDTGTVLLWNKPSTAAGGAVEGYVVERSDDGGTTWDEIADEDDTGTARTDWTDPEHLAMGEMRMYRVAAKNSAGTGASAMIGYLGYHIDDGHTHPPVTTGELTVPSLPSPTVETVGGVKIISVLWDSGEGEERQIVQLLTENRMFVDVQTVGPDAITADFKGPDSDGDGVADGVAPGTYRVQIVARGTGTDFRNSGTVLVTVE